MLPLRLPLPVQLLILWAISVLALPSLRMVHRDTDGDQSNKDPTLNIPYRNIAFGVGFGASKSLLDHISDRGQSGSTNADVPPPDSQTRAAAPQPRPLIQSAHDIDIHFTEQWEKDDVRDCIIHEVRAWQP